MNIENLEKLMAVCLPGHLGIVITQADKSEFKAELKINTTHLAPNGFLHAGTIVTLADTCAGYGCVANLPIGAAGFTTIELKINYFRPVWETTLKAEGKVVRRGGTVGYIECEITDDQNRFVAKASSTCIILRGEQAKGR